jgi:hypothetical protein
MVVVEPRGAAMALFTLRAAEEVRAAQFGLAEGELDPEMVAIGKAIIAPPAGVGGRASGRRGNGEDMRRIGDVL